MRQRFEEPDRLVQHVAAIQADHLTRGTIEAIGRGFALIGAGS